MEAFLLLLGITLLLLIIFLFVYLRNKARISSGLWFNFFLLSAGLTFVYASLYTQNAALMLLVYMVLLAALFVALFGVFVLIALLLINARAMLKRERRSLANCLTLIVALALIAWLVVSAVLSSVALPLWARAIQLGFTAVLLYYFVHVYLFFSSLFLCNLARPRLRQDYIVVLGSGLVDGKVSPLLAGRIDRAIRFYEKQRKKKGRAPKLVLSGGQGADEPMAESVAMRDYALQKGISHQNILVEDLSRNTMENMKFSKHVMDADAAGKPYRAIFASSNYHLLRGGIYARQAGIAMDGIGSRTALYYLPTALLREYIAFFRLYLRTHLIIAGGLFVFFSMFYFLPEIIARMLA